MKLRNILMGAAAGALCASAALAERGSDGQLNILYWQAVSIMTPYLSSGTKDLAGGEPGDRAAGPLQREGRAGALSRAGDPDRRERRGVGEDLTTITWKLKDGLLWSDGTPVTAEDAVFTWQYCTDPDGGCSQIPNFSDVKNVEAVDPQTIKVTFSVPKPFPYGPFVGAQSPIIQKEQFADCLGAKAPDVHRGQHQADRHRAVRGRRTSRPTTWCCWRPTRTSAIRRSPRSPPWC